MAESGSAYSRILVAAYGSGALPRITGATNCIRLEGSYLTLREVHADGCSWGGVYISGNHDLLEESLVTGNAAGVYVREGASRNEVLRNTIRDNNRMSVLTESSTSGDSGAFGILLRGDYTEVAWNTISGSDAFSYDYGRDGAAVEIYGGQNNHVHHNHAFDNDVFTELGGSRAADNVFAYNVVRSSLNESVFLVTRGAASSYGPVARTRVFHNTVYMTGASSEGVVCHAGCSADILTMRNNIVVAVQQSGYSDAPFDEDYNLFWGGRVRWTLGSNSRFADPQFVDPNAANLRPRAWSPAVDRGQDLSGYTLDLDRLAAPVDGDGDGVARRDMGAFEYRR
jgi:hypothetical protein